MDIIIKLQGLSTWDLVQNIMFPHQGLELDKVYVFNMPKLGPNSSVDLVRQMQLISNLKHP